jgi:hypothetical protein
MGKQKTLGEAMAEIKELEGKAAVHTAAVSYFRTRYLRRDSDMPTATLKNPDNSPVDPEIIELMCTTWEEEAEEMLEAAATYRSEIISG